jgi:hypothetical protein
MSYNRPREDFSLSYDQRILLEMYLNFYNHTSRQIHSLQELQNEIRGNINQLVGLGDNSYSHNATGSQNRYFQQPNASSNRPQPNQRRQTRTRDQSTNPPLENHSNQRVFYVEGVPYLIDMTNVWRRNNATQGTTADWRAFYDNVVVAPTRAQIENSTRVIRYSEIENPTNQSCPITLDRFENDSTVTQILHCGHIFTPTGIESWLRSNVRCPVCRYDIRNHVAAAEQQNEPIVEEPHSPSPSPSENTPNQSQPQDPERNSNPREQRRTTTENISNVLSNITEELINNILSPNGGPRSVFDPSYSSLVYDTSNNQFVFEGYIRH